MKLIQLTLLAVLIGFTACSKDKKTNDLDCTNVMCTLEFKTITVDLVNSDGKVLGLGHPYFLERRIEGNDQIIEIKNEVIDKFVVLDDSHKSILKPEGTSIIVKVFRVGIAGNDLINTSKFVIGADCCHIQKISGPDSITVD